MLGTAEYQCYLRFSAPSWRFQSDTEGSLHRLSSNAIFIENSVNKKEKMTRPYHFKKFDFAKGIPLQKSKFLKR